MQRRRDPWAPFRIWIALSIGLYALRAAFVTTPLGAIPGFVLLLMVATALAFQLPVLQLLLGALGLIKARTMLAAWRWVVVIAAIAGAVLTPSTDPVTMLLLSGAITALFLLGVALVALAERLKPSRAPGA